MWTRTRMCNRRSRKRRQSGINLAVSNPCFELWLVLHCQDQAASIHRSEIQRDAKKLNLIHGKSIPASAWKTLRDNHEDARRRARELDSMHEGNDSPPRSNPSSDVWRLVDRLRSWGSAAVVAAENW